MNVLFLTLSARINIKESGIYSDLMRCFAAHGHSVYIVSPVERKYKQPTSVSTEDNVHYLRVRTLNIQKTNIIEKGIGTLLLENQFCRAIKKHLADTHFDLVLYSTPPITFANVVKYVKKKDPTAISYLLLKDIFPQNAVDLGMFSEHSLFNWYFRRKEEQLYRLSDYIGCMSPANVEFILRHNPFVQKSQIEVAPNSIDIQAVKPLKKSDREKLLQNYHIPTNKTIFIYGGNLGKPQGIPFLIQCLDANKHRNDCHFVVVGNGTEYGKLRNWYDSQEPQNATVMKALPKDEYDQLVQACHVGLIFLDYRFTIPNFPSRLLSYLQYSMPIIAATDPNTDMGKIAEENHFGYACHSNDVGAFTASVDKVLQSDIPAMGRDAYQFLCDNYSVEHTYNAIIRHF